MKYFLPYQWARNVTAISDLEECKKQLSSATPYGEQGITDINNQETGSGPR